MPCYHRHRSSHDTRERGSDAGPPGYEEGSLLHIAADVMSSIMHAFVAPMLGLLDRIRHAAGQKHVKNLNLASEVRQQKLT